MSDRRNALRLLARVVETEYPQEYGVEALTHDARQVFDTDAGRRVLCWLVNQSHILTRLGAAQEPVRSWVEGRKALVLDLLQVLDGEWLPRGGSDNPMEGEDTWPTM